MAGSHTRAADDIPTTDPTSEQTGPRLVSTGLLGLEARLAGVVDGHLVTFAEHVREGLLAASTAVGLEVMAELMEAEVTELVGPRGRHDPDRTAKRHGGEPGSVTLGGRRLPVTRPRVRTVAERRGDEREVELESYMRFAADDLLAEGIVARMLAGIFTRRYPVSLELVGVQVDADAVSTSKSAVSRRFVTATGERLAQLLDRPLDQTRWVAVMLDGVHFGDHLLVVALGVAAEDGTKVPLGVVEGALENAAVCARLVADLADRGLDCSRGVLFVVDAGLCAVKGDPSGLRRQGAGATVSTPQGTQRAGASARGRAAAGPAPHARRLGQGRRRRGRARPRADRAWPREAAPPARRRRCVRGWPRRSR